MLKLFKRRQKHTPRVVADPNATRADLEIRNLLDYPNLRRAMGLDSADESDNTKLHVAA